MARSHPASDPHTDAELTRNQSLVLEALRDAGAPVTAYGLLDILREAGFRAPPQIYRALEKLQARGLVHRLETLNAYMPCQHDHADRTDIACDRAAIFAICEKCGRAIEMAEDELLRTIAGKAAARGFSMREVTVELRGLCDPCRDSPGAGT